MEQSAAASAALKERSVELADEVARFRLPQQDSHHNGAPAYT